MRIEINVNLDDDILVAKAREMLVQFQNSSPRDMPLEIFETKVDNAQRIVTESLRADDTVKNLEKMYSVYTSAIIASSLLTPDNDRQIMANAAKMFKKEFGVE